MREWSMPCPPADGKEFTGTWEGGYGLCSATCGKGVQSFEVKCDTGDENDCDPEGEWRRHSEANARRLLG